MRESQRGYRSASFRLSADSLTGSRDSGSVVAIRRALQSRDRHEAVLCTSATGLLKARAGAPGKKPGQGQANAGT
jgi:hypothetical protein